MENRKEAGEGWTPTWTQAMTDFRGEDDEPGFDDVTVRMTLPASLGGVRLRMELSNRFGDAPVRIGRGAVGVGSHFVPLGFDGRESCDIPPTESRFSDEVDLPISRGDDIIVDLYLPNPTPYATAAGFRFDRSAPGDYAGSLEFPLEGAAPVAADELREFPATNTAVDVEEDGSGWSLPAGGPFLRSIEVAGSDARAVVVALGGSSTAMGWPQYAAQLLPEDARVAIVNRGISGNRILRDAPVATPSWGRSGLSRFDEDVLGTAGITHVVIAYNSNDWGIPGRLTALDELPSVAQLIDGYRELAERAEKAGVSTILATVTPLSPELRTDPEREGIRLALNDWIRASGHEVVDFDAAIRSGADPSRLAREFAAPDDTHPSINGEKQLAQAVAAVLERLD